MTDTDTDRQADPRLDIARRNLRVAIALRETNFSEVARQAGLSRNVVQRFVSGASDINYSSLMRVCDALNVPIALLHRPDTITDGRLRLQRALDRLPDHALQDLLARLQTPPRP